jgi:hypothetical protein
MCVSTVAELLRPRLMLRFASHLWCILACTTSCFFIFLVLLIFCHVEGFFVYFLFLHVFLYAVSFFILIALELVHCVRVRW